MARETAHLRHPKLTLIYNNYHCVSYPPLYDPFPRQTQRHLLNIVKLTLIFHVTNLRFKTRYSHKTKILSFNGKQQLLTQHCPATVQWDVQARNAGVGCRQVRIIRRPYRHRWHRLEPILASWQCRRTRPKIHLQTTR